MRRLFMLPALLFLTASVGAVASPTASAATRGAKMRFFIEPDNVSAARNGDTLQLSGSGTFNQTTSGRGVFTHRSAAGAVLASGTWKATQLISFRSFGPATPEQVATLGLPPGSQGGRALFLIHLSPVRGPGHTALLTVTCLLGHPPAGAKEGNKVQVLGGLNFSQIVEGDNLFVRG